VTSRQPARLRREKREVGDVRGQINGDVDHEFVADLSRASRRSQHSGIWALRNGDRRTLTHGPQSRESNRPLAIKLSRRVAAILQRIRALHSASVRRKILSFDGKIICKSVGGALPSFHTDRRQCHILIFMRVICVFGRTAFASLINYCKDLLVMNSKCCLGNQWHIKSLLSVISLLNIFS